MAEKIITRETKSTVTMHQFYCDECGSYIGESFESDDGYYKKLGDFEQQYYIDNKRYSLQGTLCLDCRKKLIQRVAKALEKIGFRKEDGLRWK